MQALDTFEKSFDRLQNRFDSGIVVVDTKNQFETLALKSLDSTELDEGFVDISAKPRELAPLIGRVVLLLNPKDKVYNPAVITKRASQMQITRMNVPFDPKVGLTKGILFGLGVKNSTADSSFGAHGYGKYESGHIAPAFVGVADMKTRNELILGGHDAAHGVLDDQQGGAPEKFIDSGLLRGINIETKALPDIETKIPLYWHKGLESDDGLMIAQYDGAVRLMLGSATLALGDEAVDKVGELVTHTTRGVI